MRKMRLVLVLLIAAATLILIASSLFAGEDSLLKGKDIAKLVRGGVLYDNWSSELGIATDGTHPSYPAEGKKKGKSTWRCKECHGWDYQGKAGAYSKGSHYTGIKGIRAYENRNPEDILKILKNDVHAFNNVISDDALEALSLFVAYGQIDADPYINRDTMKSSGDPMKGSRIYLTTCIKCHGEDGKEMNFGSASKPEYVGTIANKNPWEALHKIRWGQPGSQMISLLFLELNDQLDVLSYCQTLPEK